MEYQLGKSYSFIVRGCIKKNRRLGRDKNIYTILGPDKQKFKVSHYYKLNKGTTINCTVCGFTTENKPIFKVCIEDYHKEPNRPAPISTTKSIRAIPTPMGGKVK